MVGGIPCFSRYSWMIIRNCSCSASRLSPRAVGSSLEDLFELVYPRFSGLVSPPCPAKLLELVGQFTARIRVNAFRRGEHHLHLGEAAVAAEVGIAAIADVDDVLAGDLRNRAGPLASVRLLLAIGLGRLLRLAASGCVRSLPRTPSVFSSAASVTGRQDAWRRWGFPRRISVCVVPCRPHLPEAKRVSYSPGRGRCQSVRSRFPNTTLGPASQQACLLTCHQSDGLRNRRYCRASGFHFQKHSALNQKWLSIPLIC